MNTTKIWRCARQDNPYIEKMACEFGINPVVARVLANRGFKDAAEIRRFLNPDLNDLADPFLMKDMKAGTDRIAQAVRHSQRIIVYGDYDVDGITGTAVLADFLRKLGAEADYYIPDRIEDGYGLSMNVVEKLRKMEPDLVITVDCGITAVDEVEALNRAGIDVVITDHHECGEHLPGASAVINPCRHDCEYPFKHLAGVGVVFKLVEALRTELHAGNAGIPDIDTRNYLELVAIGTIADVMPLIGENRIIAKFGLERINHTENMGLRELIHISGLKDKVINAWMIGFVIAPRINAAGRMSSAKKAVELFLSDDAGRVREIAAALDEENKTRQQAESEILQQVIERIDGDVSIAGEKIIVVDGENWHQGVIGIVASRITDKYHKPCVLLSNDGDTVKGSARSIEGFNIYNALDACRKLLEKFGGHELAAGLTLRSGDIDSFRTGINEYARLYMGDTQLKPFINIDAELDSENLNMECARSIGVLAPFGAGNREPVFCCKGLKINEIRTTSDKKHLKLKLSIGNTTVDAIGFNMGERVFEFQTGDDVDVAFNLEVNSWNSFEKVQLNLRDIRKNKGGTLDGFKTKI